MKAGEHHAGRYSSQRNAESYAEALRLYQPGLQVEVRPATVYDVVITDAPTGVIL